MAKATGEMRQYLSDTKTGKEVMRESYKFMFIY